MWALDFYDTYSSEGACPGVDGENCNVSYQAYSNPSSMQDDNEYMKIHIFELRKK